MHSQIPSKRLARFQGSKALPLPTGARVLKASTFFSWSGCLYSRSAWMRPVEPRAQQITESPRRSLMGADSFLLLEKSLVREPYQAASCLCCPVHGAVAHRAPSTRLRWATTPTPAATWAGRCRPGPCARPASACPAPASPAPSCSRQAHFCSACLAQISSQGASRIESCLL